MTEINKTFPELLDDSFSHLHFIQEMFQNQLSYAFDMSFHLKKIMMLSIRFCYFFEWNKTSTKYLARVLLNLLKITHKKWNFIETNELQYWNFKNMCVAWVLLIKAKHLKKRRNSWCKMIETNHDFTRNSFKLEACAYRQTKVRFALNEFRWVQQMFSID